MRVDHGPESGLAIHGNRSKEMRIGRVCGSDSHHVSRMDWLVEIGLRFSSRRTRPDIPDGNEAVGTADSNVTGG